MPPSGEVVRPSHGPSQGAVLDMSRPGAPPNSPANRLYKQRSWSPDTPREEAWLRRKGNCKNRLAGSVTDDDLVELRACIELGFGFDKPPADQRLSRTLPALELFYAVNKQYQEAVSKPSGATSDSETPSPVSSPHGIFGPDEDPETRKTRLRQWAQVVACSVRQRP